MGPIRGPSLKRLNQNANRRSSRSKQRLRSSPTTFAGSVVDWCRDDRANKLTMTLTTIISGGQNGVDVAALRAAKAEGLKTGGMMPKGFRTLDGPRQSYRIEFGLTEHSSASYPSRTAWNVRNSDGTLRIAADFQSAGEICTKYAIDRYRKPH